VSSSLPQVVKIADLNKLVLNQDVEVICKVLNVSEVKTVKRSADQKCVGDETGSCRLVLWEGNVDSLQAGKSYRLADVKVKKWGMMKYLGFTSDSTKEVADDVKDVKEEMIAGDEDEDYDGRSVCGQQ